MARGDDAYLPTRDRGPVRKLVRDVVDARRNVGSFFLVRRRGRPGRHDRPEPAVKNYATLLLFGFFLVIDHRLGRAEPQIKRKVAERFPERRPRRPAAVLVRHQPVHDDPPLALPEARRRRSGADV